MIELAAIRIGEDGEIQDEFVSLFNPLRDRERVLEDRRIEPDEGDALIQTATRWGLSLEQVERLHGEFLRRLGAVALIDGIVADAEPKDIHQVATLLGRSTVEVDKALNEAELQMAGFAERIPAAVSDLTGQTVCFTGELLGTIKGNSIDRSTAQMMAARAGLTIQITLLDLTASKSGMPRISAVFARSCPP